MVDIIWKGRFAISRTSILAIRKDLETFYDRITILRLPRKGLQRGEKKEEEENSNPFPYLDILLEISKFGFSWIYIFLKTHQIYFY